MNIHQIKTPSSVEEAYQLLLEDPKNKVIGGGAWLRLTNIDVPTVINLDELNLSYIQEDDQYIKIGAMTTLREIERHPVIRTHLGGVLADAISHIMGVQVRNLATIGGSVMGKYSFSDILPVLLVMKTTLVFHKQHDVNLNDYIQQKHPENDILLAIKIQKESGKAYFHKVSKTVLDFSLINIAMANTDQLYIQIGARPGSTKPAVKTAAYLESEPNWTDEVIANAVELIGEEISISSNAKASKEYRQDVLKAYFKRGLKEVK